MWGILFIIVASLIMGPLGFVSSIALLIYLHHN